MGGQEATSQVFIQGTNVGNTYTDTNGQQYPGSTATIVRGNGAAASYTGTDIGGDTTGASANVRGVEVNAGATATFNGTTNITANNSGGNSFGVTATGTGSTATFNQLNLIMGSASTSIGVNVAAGNTVNLGAGSSITSNTATAGRAAIAVAGTVTGNALTVESNRGIDVQAGGVLSLTGANTITGRTDYGLGIAAGGSASLGSGSLIQRTTDGVSYGITFTGTGSSATAENLTINYNRGVNVANNVAATLSLTGAANSIQANGTAANSYGVTLGTGASLTMLAGGTLAISTVNGNGINVGASSSFSTNGDVSIVTGTGVGINLADQATYTQGTGTLAIDASGTGISNGTGIAAAGTGALALPTGTRITSFGNGINVTGSRQLTATDLSVTTRAGGAGAGIVLAAGSVANLSGATAITSQGSGNGLTLNSASADLGTGAVIRTETGMAIRTTGTGTFTARDLTIVTNTSQQDLTSVFTALPEYPNPATFDVRNGVSALDAYAAASPATGLSLSPGSATLSGTTSIRTGGAGIVADALSGVSHVDITGTLAIQAGPGGDVATSIGAVNVIRGAELNAVGNIQMQVDSFGGGGVRSSSNANVVLDVRGSGDPLRISMVNRKNVPQDATETAALHAVAGNISVFGDAQFESWQSRGYGLWNHDLPGSSIKMMGNTAIQTHGRESFGVRMDDGAMLFDGNLSIVTGRDPASADAVDGGGAAAIRAIVGALDIRGSTNIETHGSSVSVGFDQNRESAFGVWNTSVSRELTGSASLSFGGPVQIQTFGNAAHGVYNDSAAGTIDFAGPVTIATQGSTDTVTWRRVAGVPEYETIGAWGVNAALSGTTTFRNGLSVTTSGNGSGGVRSAGGLVDMQQGATISTGGAGAHGLVATSAAGLYNGRLQAAGLLDVSVSGAGSHGMLADQSGRIDFTGGARLRVADPAAFGILAGDSAVVNGSGQFDVVANLKSAGNAQVNLSLAPGSVLTGTTTTADASRFNLTLADSRWNLTGNSTLSTLVNDPSLIVFAPPTGGAFKTLTVANYVGQGGGLLLNTFLGADGSPSDRLVISGGMASGQSTLAIANAGGPGAITTANGIQVVQPVNGATTAADAFTMSGRAVAGAYEYRLFKGSRDASDPEGWFLRSERAVPPTPPEPPQPLYRPEVAAYLANQRLAGQVFVHSLHDRLGEPQYVEDQGFNRDQDKPQSGWLRVVGKWEGSRSADANFKVSSDTFLLHGGTELAKWSVFGEGDRGHMGVMGSHGLSSTNATARDNPFSAKGKVEGWGVGTYGTWFQNDENKLGAYIDTWFQYGWFSNRVEGELLPTVKYNAQGWAVSGETGYAMPLRNDWIIEPQAQLIYVGYDEDDTTEPNGTRISGASSHGWISRLGARTYRTYTRDDGRKWQPYATVNWWHSNVGSSVTFNQLPLGSLYPENRYELKLGVNVDLRKRWMGWANISGSWGAQSFYQYATRIGVKYAW